MLSFNWIFQKVVEKLNISATWNKRMLLPNREGLDWIFDNISGTRNGISLHKLKLHIFQDHLKKHCSPTEKGWVEFFISFWHKKYVFGAISLHRRFGGLCVRTYILDHSESIDIHIKNNKRNQISKVRNCRNVCHFFVFVVDTFPYALLTLQTFTGDNNSIQLILQKNLDLNLAWNHSHPSLPPYWLHFKQQYSLPISWSFSLAVVCQSYEQLKE